VYENYKLKRPKRVKFLEVNIMKELKNVCLTVVENVKTIGLNTSRVKLIALLDDTVNDINLALVGAGLQKKTTTKEEVKALNLLLKEGHVCDTTHPDYELSEMTISTCVSKAIDGINQTLQSHILDIASSNIPLLMQGKLFTAQQLNESIPQLRLYKKITNGLTSGYFVTLIATPYTLSMLFPNDKTCVDAINALSYKLDNVDSFNDCVEKANEMCINGSRNTSNTSIRAKFYKNAIGELSNRYYKGILDELCKHIIEALGVDIKSSMFNAICLEWLASKAVKDCRLTTFKANKSFNADSVLYQYVKTALYHQDVFGKMQTIKSKTK
jgi:S-adenosylmethionine/arginine decarboxylase-like enzyme